MSDERNFMQNVENDDQQHHHIMELLDAYVTEELTTEESTAVENHLLQCSGCQEKLSEIRHLHQQFASFRESFSDTSPQKTYPSLAESVLRQIQAMEQQEENETSASRTFYASDETRAVSRPLLDPFGVIYAESDQASFIKETRPESHNHWIIRPPIQKRGSDMIKRFSKATGTKQEQTQTAQQQDASPSSRASRQGKKTTAIAMLVSLAILASVLLFFTHGTTKGTKLAGGNQHYTPTPIATLPIMPIRLNTGWVKRWTYPAFLSAPDKQLVEIISSPSENGVLYLCPPSPFIFTTTPITTPVTNTVATHYLYRSNDAGKNWTRLPLPAGVVGCLLKADPVMAGRIVIQDTVHYQIYLSNDHGSSWQLITPPLSLVEGDFILPVAGRLYLGGYWSMDFQHWKRWAPAVPQGEPFLVAVGSEPPYPIYAMFSGKCVNLPPGANGGFIPNLCRSDDDGHSWHFLISIQGDGPVEGVFCLAHNNPTTLFAWGSASHPYFDIQSRDGGATWTPLSVKPGIPNLACETSFRHPSALGDESIAEQQALPGVPIEPITLAITSSGLAYQASFEKTRDVAGNYTTGGISIWKDNRWRVIASPPFKYKTAAGNEPRILLITPKSGPPHLYAFTGTDLYEYTGPFTLN